MRAAAEALAYNRSITKIYLDRRNMGSEEAKAIAQALENNSTIQYMDLSENNIDYDGIKELVAASKNNSTITKIDLRYNRPVENIPPGHISSQGAIMLAKALQNHWKNTKIDLRGSNLSPEEKETLTDIMGNKHTIIRFNEWLYGE
ncbi:hypothetical protein [Candidatus Cardinium hertigii]|uniref:Uncharacterized protein n=1 Tax=Candidatus Cardinium hertigii TaxID=247481 RepID=A0A3N2QD95_9BACT|nr:hypothetical protein [Candidatus Cardinium hertigii]ROT47602.1 hypothetical protein EDM02_01360 [Candidatus Cardinium hertigii]